MCSGDCVQVVGGRDTVSGFLKQRDATLAQDPMTQVCTRSVLQALQGNVDVLDAAGNELTVMDLMADMNLTWPN